MRIALLTYQCYNSNINSIKFNMHILNLALSYLISNVKYMDFFSLNPFSNFHITLYSKYIVNYTIFFTVYSEQKNVVEIIIASFIIVILTIRIN